MRYEIEQTTSGVVLGVHEGETADEAIAAMLADAGCTDEPDAGLEVREVDDIIHAWDSSEYGFLAGGEPGADDIDDYFTVANFLHMFGGTAPSCDDMASIRAEAHKALDSDEDSSSEIDQEDRGARHAEWDAAERAEQRRLDDETIAAEEAAGVAWAGEPVPRPSRLGGWVDITDPRDDASSMGRTWEFVAHPDVGEVERDELPPPPAESDGHVWMSGQRWLAR